MTAGLCQSTCRSQGLVSSQYLFESAVTLLTSLPSRTATLSLELNSRRNVSSRSRRVENSNASPFLYTSPTLTALDYLAQSILQAGVPTPSDPRERFNLRVLAAASAEVRSLLCLSFFVQDQIVCLLTPRLLVDSPN